MGSGPVSKIACSSGRIPEPPLVSARGRGLNNARNIVPKNRILKVSQRDGAERHLRPRRFRIGEHRNTRRRRTQSEEGQRTRNDGEHLQRIGMRRSRGRQAQNEQQADGTDIESKSEPENNFEEHRHNTVRKILGKSINGVCLRLPRLELRHSPVRGPASPVTECPLLAGNGTLKTEHHDRRSTCQDIRHEARA